MQTPTSHVEAALVGEDIGRLKRLKFAAIFVDDGAESATRVDHLLGMAVAFFADLLPLPSRDLEDTYKTAREFAADLAARQI